MRRESWIDIAKGVAMMAVVFSHEFASVHYLTTFLASFMLPTFFNFWLFD